MDKMPPKYKGPKLNVATYPVDEDAYIPEETYGYCITKDCMEVDWLADGYCMSCWDKMSTLKYNRHISTVNT